MGITIPVMQSSSSSSLLLSSMMASIPTTSSSSSSSFGSSSASGAMIPQAAHQSSTSPNPHLFSPSGHSSSSSSVSSMSSQYLHHPHQFLFPPPLPFLPGATVPPSLGFSPQSLSATSTSSSLSSHKFSVPYSSSMTSISTCNTSSSSASSSLAHFPVNNFFPDLPVAASSSSSSSYPYSNPYLHHFLLNNPLSQNSNCDPAQLSSNLGQFGLPPPAAAAPPHHPPFSSNFPFKVDDNNPYGGAGGHNHLSRNNESLENSNRSNNDLLSKSLYSNPYWIGSNSLYPSHSIPFGHSADLSASMTTTSTTTATTTTDLPSPFGSPFSSDYFFSRNSAAAAALYGNYYSNYLAALNSGHNLGTLNSTSSTTTTSATTDILSTKTVASSSAVPPSLKYPIVPVSTSSATSFGIGSDLANSPYLSPYHHPYYLNSLSSSSPFLAYQANHRPQPPLPSHLLPQPLPQPPHQQQHNNNNLVDSHQSNQSQTKKSTSNLNSNSNSNSSSITRTTTSSIKPKNRSNSSATSSATSSSSRKLPSVKPKKEEPALEPLWLHGKKQFSKVSKSKNSKLVKKKLTSNVKLEKKVFDLSSISTSIVTPKLENNASNSSTTNNNVNKKQKKLKDLIKDHELEQQEHHKIFENRNLNSQFESKMADLASISYKNEDELKIDCHSPSVYPISISKIKSETLVSPPPPQSKPLSQFSISNLMKNDTKFETKSESIPSVTKMETITESEVDLVKKFEPMVDSSSSCSIRIKKKPTSPTSCGGDGGGATIEESNFEDYIPDVSEDEDDNNEDGSEDSESNTNLVIDLSVVNTGSNDDGGDELDGALIDMSPLSPKLTTTTTTTITVNTTSTVVASPPTSIDQQKEEEEEPDNPDVTKCSSNVIVVTIMDENQPHNPSTTTSATAATAAVKPKQTSSQQQQQEASSQKNRMAKFRKLQSYRKNVKQTSMAPLSQSHLSEPVVPSISSVPSGVISTTTTTTSPSVSTSPSLLLLSPPTAPTTPGVQSNTITSTNTESLNRNSLDLEASYELATTTTAPSSVDTSINIITTTTTISASCLSSPNSMMASTPSPTISTSSKNIPGKPLLVSPVEKPGTGNESRNNSPVVVGVGKKSKSPNLVPAKRKTTKTLFSSASSCDEIKPNKIKQVPIDHCDSTATAGPAGGVAKLLPLSIKIEPTSTTSATNNNSGSNKKPKTISGKVSATAKSSLVKSISGSTAGSATSHHRNSSTSNKRNMNKIPIGIAIAQQRTNTSGSVNQLLQKVATDSNQIQFAGKTAPITINVGAAAAAVAAPGTIHGVQQTGTIGKQAANFVQTLPTVLSPILITGPGLLQVSQQPHPTQQQHAEFGTISTNHNHHLSTPTAYNTFHHHQSTNQIQTYSANANSIPSPTTVTTPTGASNCQIFRDSITGQLYLISAPPTPAQVQQASSPVLATPTAAIAANHHHHHLIPHASSIKLANSVGQVPGTIQLQTLPPPTPVPLVPPSCISINQRNMISASSSTSSSVTGSSSSTSTSSEQSSICSMINQQQQQASNSTFISINSINSINSSNTTNYIINNHHTSSSNHQNISKTSSFHNQQQQSSLYQQRSETLINDQDSLQPMEICGSGENDIDEDDELIISTNTVGFQVDMDSLHTSEDEDETSLGRIHKLTYLNSTGEELENEDSSSDSDDDDEDDDDEDIEEDEVMIGGGGGQHTVMMMDNQINNLDQGAIQHTGYTMNQHMNEQQQQQQSYQPPVLPVKSAPVMQFIDSHGLDSLVDYFEEFTANSQCTLSVSSQDNTPATTPTPPAFVGGVGGGGCTTSTATTTTYSSTGIQAGHFEHNEQQKPLSRIRSNHRISEFDDEDNQDNRKAAKSDSRRTTTKRRGRGGKRVQSVSFTVDSEPEEEEEEEPEEELEDDDDSSQSFNLPNIRRSERIFLNDSVKLTTVPTNANETNLDLSSSNSSSSLIITPSINDKKLSPSPVISKKTTLDKKASASLQSQSDCSLSTSSSSSSSTTTTTTHLKMKIVKYKNTLSKSRKQNTKLNLHPPLQPPLPLPQNANSSHSSNTSIIIDDVVRNSVDRGSSSSTNDENHNDDEPQPKSKCMTKLNCKVSISGNISSATTSADNNNNKKTKTKPKPNIVPTNKKCMNSNSSNRKQSLSSSSSCSTTPSCSTTTSSSSFTTTSSSSIALNDFEKSKISEFSKNSKFSNDKIFSPLSTSSSTGTSSGIFSCAKEIMKCDSECDDEVDNRSSTETNLSSSSSQKLEKLKSTDEIISLSLKAGDLDRPNLNVIMAVDSLLFIGVICPIQPPDIYGIVLHGERQHRPLIYSQEEMLEQAILEIKPKVSELKSGQRVCAFWSNKYRHLYPGYVREESPSSSPSTQSSPPSPLSSLVFIEFDDGDRGTIPIEDIRLLPQSYPKMELTSDPFRMFDKHNPHNNSYRNRQNRSNNFDDQTHHHQHRHSHDHRHRHRHHHGGGHNHRKHVRSISISESFKLDDERRNQRQQKAEVELQQRQIAKSKDYHSTSDTKLTKSPKKRVSKSKNATESNSDAFISGDSGDLDESMTLSTIDYEDQWMWWGKVLRVNGNKAARTRKVYYDAIKRGETEIIKLNDSAVFVSKSRPDLPYIGRIDSMWQNFNNEMIVKVCWYYHPEETVNCPLKTNLKGALFQSYHCDVNDIQTISHKCRVLSCNEINRKHTSLRHFLLDNNNNNNYNNEVAAILEKESLPVVVVPSAGDTAESPEVATESTTETTKSTEIDITKPNLDLTKTTGPYFVVGHYEPLSATFKFDKLVQENRDLFFQE